MTTDDDDGRRMQSDEKSSLGPLSWFSTDYYTLFIDVKRNTSGFQFRPFGPGELIIVVTWETNYRNAGLGKEPINYECNNNTCNL